MLRAEPHEGPDSWVSCAEQMALRQAPLDAELEATIVQAERLAPPLAELTPTTVRHLQEHTRTCCKRGATYYHWP